MIPIFPKFKKLSLEDRPAIRRIIRKYPPYSDYNFASLWTWNLDSDVEISLLNENLVVKFSDYITGDPFYSFIGKREVSETTDILLKQSKKEKMKAQLKLFPRTNITSHEFITNYRVKEDKDNFDYIYSIKEVVKLEGKRYAVKRNFINRFSRLYNSSHRIINMDDKVIQRDMIRVLAIWQKTRDKSYKEVRNEFRAIKRAAKYWKELKLVAIGLYVDDIMVGFSINEVLQQGYAMNLFEKGDITYQGIFQYLRYITCLYLNEKKCHLLNFEQDLGLEGLRKSKLSYHPKFFLKKYIVSRN